MNFNSLKLGNLFQSAVLLIEGKWFIFLYHLRRICEDK